MHGYIGDKGYWEGRVWFIWILWTILGYYFTIEILNIDFEYYFLLVLLCLILWCAWLFGLIKAIKLIKETFYKK
jgi:hypothetical protein